MHAGKPKELWTLQALAGREVTARVYGAARRRVEDPGGVMADSIGQRWEEAYRRWERQRLGVILDGREREFRDVMEWLGLGVYVEFVPLGSVVDNDTSPEWDGLGVRVRGPHDTEEQGATLTLVPVAKASNASPEYVVNVVGPCRTCGRRTELEPTLHLVAGHVQERGDRDVPTLLGQALVQRRPVRSHDCTAVRVDRGETHGPGAYL